jgi:hypothetical protein
MNKYGEKMEVHHPNPDYASRVWFEDVGTIVWETTNLETGEQLREKFTFVSEL